MTRRELIGTIFSGSALAVLTAVSKRFEGGIIMAQETEKKSGSTLQSPPAYRGENQVKPLPFDPAKLPGLSEKMLVSHHQNNYTGAVRRLNQIQQQIGSLPKDAQPYQMGSLKREEILATNSMILHELYFGNLGGGGKPEGSVAQMIDSRYGSLANWEQDFRLTGMSLGGGSGWVILNYSYRDNAVHNYWAADHSNSLAWGVPLLVMDMYEHAYAMDYGANARGYVDAFFKNVNWSEVDRRVETLRRS